MLHLTDMEVVHLLLLLAFMAGILGSQVASLFEMVTDHLIDRFLDWEERRDRINAARERAHG